MVPMSYQMLDCGPNVSSSSFAFVLMCLCVFFTRVPVKVFHNFHFKITESFICWWQIEALSFKVVKVERTLQPASLKSFIELLRKTAGNKGYKTAFLK